MQLQLKIKKAIPVVCFLLCILLISTTEPLHWSQTRIGNHPNWITYTNTFLGTTGVDQELLDFVRMEYGDSAVDALIQGITTGDFYQYRSITGYWKNTQSDPKLKAYAMSDRADPVWYLTASSALTWETVVYNYLGPYATMADYAAVCQQYGVTKPFASSGAGSSVEAQLFGNMPLKGTWITQKQYLANHSTAAATSSNSAVEALKTYSGNTSEFNAYTYYTRYADLQSAVGANGDALLKHWQAYGKAEGRIAN